MNQSVLHFFISVILYFTIFLQIGYAQLTPSDLEKELWQVGDEWIVDVVVYDRSPQKTIFKQLQPDVNIWGVTAIVPEIKQDSNKIDYGYALHMEIVDVGNYRGTPYWKMKMTPMLNDLSVEAEKNKMKYEINSILDEVYEVWVRKRDLVLMNIVYKGGNNKGNPLTRSYANNLKVIAGGHWRKMPYDIIPYAMHSKSPSIHMEAVDNEYHKTIINKQTKDSVAVIKLYYYERYDRNNHGYITQSWKVGAKWWSTYENRSEDCIYLRATLRED